MDTTTCDICAYPADDCICVDYCADCGGTVSSCSCCPDCGLADCICD
jgi:hypothetical protein